MARTSPIRLEDLANPGFSEAALAVIEAIEAIPCEFSKAAIIEAARAECDVDLFEDEGLFGRLEEYVDGLRGEPGLSRLGRVGAFEGAKRHLIQRSRLEALYREHPEIDEIEIERPLIIAGLPRSGTTHLLNLLGADDRFRSLPWWESREPIPCVAVQRGEAEDDRRSRGAIALEQQDLLMPLFKNLYDVGNDDIHEEVELQYLCLSTIMMASSAPIGDWTRTFFARDQRPHYAFLLRALKALQWLNPRERWVLKSPQHLAFLPALVETFPDATIVVTHRDPVSVFASFATIFAYSARMVRSPVNVEETVAHAREIQQALLGGLVRDLRVLPEGRAEHVYFHEFMADDLATLERIYERADIEMTEDARRSIDRHIADHPRSRHGKVHYDLEGHLGIERASLYAVFDDYLKTFPVEREEANE